jgi:hypothetical protein
MIYTVTASNGKSAKVIASNGTIAKYLACKEWGIRITHYAMVACLKAIREGN